MPRFVVLTHDHPFLHWDLLLESGAACRTWRLLEEPAPGRTVRAEPLPDHRLHYLTYEGAVSGGRGVVTRWDAGTYRLVAESESRLVADLAGAGLRGRCVLDGSEAGWRATFAGAAAT